MDATTTIIGLAILSLFLIPVVIMSRSSKKKGSKFDRELLAEATKRGLIISEKQIFGEYGIGIDNSSKKLLFINWSGSESVATSFSFKEIKAFDTIPSANELKKPNFDLRKTERLGFRFHFQDSGRPEFSFIFYIAGFGLVGDNEIEFFTRWSKVVKKGLVTVSSTVSNSAVSA
jgi:hypothetical protein